MNDDGSDESAAKADNSAFEGLFGDVSFGDDSELCAPADSYDLSELERWSFPAGESLPIPILSCGRMNDV